MNPRRITLVSVLFLLCVAGAALADGNALHKFGRADPIDMLAARIWDSKGPLQIGTKGTSIFGLAAGDVLNGNNLEVQGLLYNQSGAVKDARVASAVINANITTLQPLWTCPASKKCYATSLMYKLASGTSSTASCGVGWDAGGSNVLTAGTNAITATTYIKKAVNTVPTSGAAAGSLGFKCGTPEGAALTFTVDVYGFAE